MLVKECPWGEGLRKNASKIPPPTMTTSTPVASHQLCLNLKPPPTPPVNAWLNVLLDHGFWPANMPHPFVSTPRFRQSRCPKRWPARAIASTRRRHLSGVSANALTSACASVRGKSPGFFNQSTHDHALAIWSWLEALDIDAEQDLDAEADLPAASPGASPPSRQVDRRTWWRSQTRAGAMLHGPGASR